MKKLPIVLVLVLAACGDPVDTPADRSDAAVADGGPTSPDGGGSAPPGLRLVALSSRDDMVSGGDALVALELPADAAESVRVTAGDTDVTDRFHLDADGRRIARLEELPLGETAVIAEAGSARAELILRNHPIAGPIFSGPHQTPYYCTTDDYGLGAPLDASCSMPTRIGYAYRTTGGAFRLLADPSVRPADVARTTTTAGVTVDYIVRVELGTINRAIYWIATLFDPAEPAWEPWQPNRAWNRKLIYYFGGGCGTGHTQGDPLLDDALNHGLLAQGYAVAHASLNTLGNNCNDVVSAETAMMVKERFVERYGVPIYTMGLGGSGGSVQQHLIANNYPGILDGLLPIASVPDIFSLLPDVVDCVLFERYFASPGGSWTDEQRRSVTGYATLVTCERLIRLLGDLLDPSARCAAEVPASAIYHPTTNPEGVRCTLQDHNVNILGRDPVTGFARRPYDNSGVQYGLEALRAGDITPAQFLDLNERIGGFGVDGELVPERSRADEEAVRIAYASGRVFAPQPWLGQTPMIDVRAYLDPTGDVHDLSRTLTTRARLEGALGDLDNHVAFIAAPEPAALATSMADALITMDAWLVALAGDPDPDRRAAMRRARPSGLADRCYLSESPVEGACPSVFVPHSTPRLTAGAPIANDVIQCALGSVDPLDYPGMTTAQIDRLRSIFSEGVCDYDAPTPNRPPHAGAWQRFD